MRIDAALQRAAVTLQRSAIASSWLDAEVLLALTVRRDRTYLMAHPECHLTIRQRRRFAGLVRKRVNGVPVAYLTGRKEFFGLEFAVNRSVLIPRPETEAVVEAVLAYATTRDTLTIADVGTGCGNIAIALARHLPRATVYASDRSIRALAVARRNAKRLGVRVRFRRGDLVQPLLGASVDVVAANLPYLPHSTDPHIRQRIKYEPAGALFTGAGGLAEYRRLFAQIAACKQLPGLIVCEVETRQTDLMRNLATRMLPGYHCNIHGVNGVGITRLEKTKKKIYPRQDLTRVR